MENQGKLQLEQIYNDEIGLFWKCLPAKMSALENEFAIAQAGSCQLPTLVAYFL
jgi:hypothetical protein